MKRLFMHFAVCILPLLAPQAALARDMVDSLSLAPFVPLVLDAVMSVAMAGYEFFVGSGTGIIYLLVWGWLAITIGLTLVKLFFPAKWIGMFGLSGDDRLVKGELSGFKLTEELLKPGIRAIIAVTILLQVQPQYITRFIVDPFLQFGAIYTESISREIAQAAPQFGSPPVVECPEWLVEKKYISPQGCRFMVQPVATVTHANNFLIKRGFQFLTQGLSGLMTLIPRGGQDFLNLITGIILIMTFVASNFFIALLIIQGIFNFGMALVLYPFKVLMYVAKPSDKDAWFHPWDAFDGIIPALKQLVITMIASIFIMAINIAVVRALFQWNSGVFVEAAGGSAASNLPNVAAGGNMGFGHHSVTWLSAILTLYLMITIFDMTRKKLVEYSSEGGKNLEGLHKTVTGDAKATWNNMKGYADRTTKIYEGSSSAVKWLRKKFWNK